MRTIGIDPGTAIMGWGIVEQHAGAVSLIACGTFTTPKQMPQSERLVSLYCDLVACLDQYKPDSAGVEELFFAKNVSTALTVGQARGVALLALGQAGVDIHEYKPMFVKQTVSGYGKADKAQMQEVVRLTLRMQTIIKPDDAADAVAIALCHLYNAPMLQRIKDARTT
ncbi:MAG: crossover junction endodeoxyribonuclease RuvC [Chloroflexi bacterium]|nr:MAG: crossover junction endodeoxyribonuclease RuvC [Chloroflexota bacterium]RLT33644.1 MAG: crossover junction endodeoxyribonuclease RuvC [Chloroflexota bacterium]